VSHRKESNMNQNVSNQKTVRIPRKMLEAIDRFLDTEVAEEMGFDSKSDVVTAAVREFLCKFGCYHKAKEWFK